MFLGGGIYLISALTITIPLLVPSTASALHVLVSVGGKEDAAPPCINSASTTAGAGATAGGGVGAVAEVAAAVAVMALVGRGNTGSQEM